MEWLTWAPLLKGYYEFQISDTESSKEQSDQLRLAIERRIMNRAKNIVGASIEDRERLKELVGEVSATTDRLFRVAYIPVNDPKRKRSSLFKVVRRFLARVRQRRLTQRSRLSK